MSKVRPMIVKKWYWYLDFFAIFLNEYTSTKVQKLFLNTNTNHAIQKRLPELFCFYRKGDYKLIYESRHPLLDTTNGKARLFRLSTDPYETNDLARKYPTLVADLLRRLKHYARKGRMSVRTPIDPRGNPRHFGNVFGGYWC
jgi:hypothetical protein